MMNRSVLSISLVLNLTFMGIALLGWVAPNVFTFLNPTVSEPDIASTARIHLMAVVNGSVTIGEMIFVAPDAFIRGDEGQHIFVGDYSNVQDGVVIHGLETFEGDHELSDNEVQVAGRSYSVYIGKRVSFAHQSQVHGPAKVGNDHLRRHAGPGVPSGARRPRGGRTGCELIGVKVASGRYVPALALVTTHEQADALPFHYLRYAYRNLNDGVVRVNVQLAKAGQPNNSIDKTSQASMHNTLRQARFHDGLPPTSAAEDDETTASPKPKPFTEEP